MNENLINKYAALAIRKGVNLQKGQTLMINTSIYAVDMTRACVKEAYAAGAKEVVVFYNDEKISREHYLHQDVETLCTIHQWKLDCRLDYFREGAAILHIISELPNVFAGVDTTKITQANLAYSKVSEELKAYTLNSKVQWCGLAVPNQEWADKVFPNDENAMEKLWKAILDCAHVREDNDPVQEWNDMLERFDHRISIMNQHHFKALRFKNSKGTDLEVGLVKNHVWAGGCEVAGNGVPFEPNIPTEEIFCMPSKYEVNGTVVSSKPLNYNGGVIDNFTITFKDGKAIAYDAQTGKEYLEQLITFDEGSAYLGEVALVPYHSPISESGILFYTTLFDENASCHLALGAAYPMNVVGGNDMSKEQLIAEGANDSMTHIDFMFGTDDMSVVGIKEDGSEVDVFVNGDFAF